VKSNEKNLPKQALYPLEQCCYVMLERGTRDRGRGAKPFLVSPTEKLVKEVIGLLLEQLEKQTEPDLRGLLRIEKLKTEKHRKKGGKIGGKKSNFPFFARHFSAGVLVLPAPISAITPAYDMGCAARIPNSHFPRH
jgi:hypothetical protein